MQGTHRNTSLAHDRVYLAKSAAKYSLLPAILPRLRKFFQWSGFVPVLIAHLFVALRLIKRPELQTIISKSGKVELFKVFALAYSHLEFRWRNIDQIILFFGVLVGLSIVIAYFVSLFLYFIVTPAYAHTYHIFHDHSHPDDIAEMLLDSVFGIAGYVDSSVSLQPGWPTPYHLALQSLFSFYSTSFIILAMLVILYYLLSVVAETAMTGTPFGKRFSVLYAPFRLIIAIAFLMPYANGLNIGQHIVLGVAKAGSNLATNGWNAFNTTSGNNPLGMSPSSLVQTPKPPDVTELVQFVMLMNACEFIYAHENPDIFSMPYIVSGPHWISLEEFTWATSLDIRDLIDFSESRDIKIVFGVDYEETYASGAAGDIKGDLDYFEGEITPTCGEITIPINVRDDELYIVQELYLQFIWDLYGGSANALFGRRLAFTYFDINNDIIAGNLIDVCDPLFDADGDLIWEYIPYDSYSWVDTDGDGFMDTFSAGGATPINLLDWGPCDSGNPPPISHVSDVVDAMQITMNTAIPAFRDVLAASGALDLDAEILNRGWGGAGIWFNRIAQENGKFSTVVRDIPYPSAYPKLMIDVMDHKKKYAPKTLGVERFNPDMGGSDESTKISFDEDGHDRQMATALYQANKHLFGKNVGVNAHKRKRFNVLEKVIDALFGGGELFNMSENLQGVSGEIVHPLVQLISAGRSLIEAAIRNLGVGVAISTSGTLLAALGEIPAEYAEVAQEIGSVGAMLASTVLVAGFILYYVVPFLPFLYFFFAVGDWIKSIFEALIGVPLWALAHLTIEGDGLFGRYAGQGYILMMDILLRPILTVFGLLASVSIYAALVIVLNDLMAVVVQNSFGIHDDTDPDAFAYVKSGVDHIFFTLMYVFLAYIMAMSSFKLIDMIPDGILRWMGGSAKSFSEYTEDPAQNLTRNVAIQGGNYFDQLSNVVMNAPNAAIGAASSLGQALRGGGGAASVGQKASQAVDDVKASTIAEKVKGG